MALLAALALGGVGAAAPTANLSCAAGGTAKYDVHRANLTVAAADERRDFAQPSLWPV